MKKPSVNVVAKLGDVRIVTYDLDGKYVWEVQRRGLFLFWKWYREKRWCMEGDKAVIIP